MARVWYLFVVFNLVLHVHIIKSLLLIFNRQAVGGQSSDSFQAVIRYSFRQSSNCHESVRFVIHCAAW